MQDEKRGKARGKAIFVGPRNFTVLPRRRTKLSSRRYIPVSMLYRLFFETFNIHNVRPFTGDSDYQQQSRTHLRAIPAPRTRFNRTCHQHDHQSQGGNHVEINFQRRDNRSYSFLRVKSFEDSLGRYETTFEEETLHAQFYV